jgi:predicted Zn-dependent protease
MPSAVERTSPLLMITLLMIALIIVISAYEWAFMHSETFMLVRDQMLKDARVPEEFGSDVRVRAALGWTLDGSSTVYAYVQGKQAEGWAFFQLEQVANRWSIARGQLRDITEGHLLTFTPVNLAPIAQLHGKARFYLVAMGGSAEPEVSDLANFFQQEAGVKAEILPTMQPSDGANDPTRKQWIAEMLVHELAEKFPQIAADEDARIMGVIDSDMYPRSMGWGYMHSYRFANKYAVVPTARLNPSFDRHPASAAIQKERLHKTALKCLGMLYFDFRENPRLESVMSFEGTLERIDSASSHFLLSDLGSQAAKDYVSGSPCLSFSIANVEGQPRLTPIHACYEPYDLSQGGYYYVDLEHGEFRSERNDVFGGGPEPMIVRRIVASHTYDGKVRAFGKSSWMNLDDTVWSVDPRTMQEIHINGVEFRRITPGSGFAADAKYVAPPDSGDFSNAWLTWEGRWKILDAYGTVWHYHGCEPNTETHCYFMDKTNPYGDRIAVERDNQDHIARALQTAGGNLPSFAERTWVFTYKGETVQRIESSDGKNVRYSFDDEGFITDVQSEDHSLHYDYDSAHRMNKIVEDAHTLRIQYDNEGRVTGIDADGRSMYNISYTGETIQVKAPEQTYVVNIREKFFQLTSKP